MSSVSAFRVRLSGYVAAMLTLCAALSGAPAPAAAQSAMPPPGCEAFLTVQFKGCLASIYWRCEDAPEGVIWESSHDEDGPVSVGTFDAEFQWLDRYHFFSGLRERLVDAGPDPAEMTRLLDDGEDRYEFSTLETGGPERRTITYIGVDRLNGDTRVVDGEELLVTEFASIALDDATGEQIYASQGNQYVLPGERLFFYGTETWSQDGVTETSDNSPVEILRPGDRGFGDVEPRYGCGAVDL
jgi:hypothetical protein